MLVLEYGFLLPDNPQHCYRLQLPDLVLFLTSSLTSPALLDTKLDIIRTAKLDTRLVMEWNLVFIICALWY